MSALLTRPHAEAPELPATLEQSVEPASALRGTVAEELAIAVAPTTGRFRPVDDLGGRWLERGALLGHVTGGKGRADAVHAPADGIVTDLLVRPGQLVRRGQGLVWLRLPGRPVREEAA